MLFDPDFRKQFLDIRCYDDSEVRAALSKPDFQLAISNLLSSLFQLNAEVMSKLFLANKLSEITAWIMSELVALVEQTTSSIEISGLEQLDSREAHIFISNHSDIAMDPILVNLALARKGFQTCHNAIGDNLLQNHLSNEIARLNKCFRVNRTTRSPKAMLISLKHQAEYIHALTNTLNENVWIAQQEGRAKNRNDATNPALLKMLSLNSSPSGREATLTSLKIVPVCISYEWDPCDQDKVARIMSPRNVSSSKNTEDYSDVLKGLLQPKGHVRIAFGQPINKADLGIDSYIGDASTIYDAYAQLIDRFIRQNYAIFPNAHAANALLSRANAQPDPHDLTGEEQSALETLKQRFSIADNQVISPQTMQLLRNYAHPLLVRAK
jgi:1-acyl-sn-glycerol-3-phosphate acyltransferase